MNSKEKLEALNYTWFYEPTCQEDADKREAIIKELETDLEILDILKTQTRERKIKPTKLWNREKKQINGYQIKALINLNEEQYDKLKEWLEK